MPRSCCTSEGVSCTQSRQLKVGAAAVQHNNSAHKKNRVFRFFNCNCLAHREQISCPFTNPSEQQGEYSTTISVIAPFTHQRNRVPLSEFLQYLEHQLDLWCRLLRCWACKQKNFCYVHYELNCRSIVVILLLYVKTLNNEEVE